MRLAFVLRRLTTSRALSTSPVDAETMIELAAAGHDVSLFVDELGPTVDSVRESGVAVEVSPNRNIDIGGQRLTSDHAVASRIASLHRVTPLDAIILSPDVGTSPSWLVPDLGSVPLGVLVGEPIQQLTRMVLDDHTMRQVHWLGQWASAGTVLDADFLVGGSHPAEFGVDLGSSLPLLHLFDPPRLSSPPDGSVRSLAVLATAADRSDLSQVVRDAWTVVPADVGTMTAVIVPEVSLRDEAVGELVLANLTKEERNRVFVVPAGRDEVAAGLLDTADVVVARSPAELGTHAVATTSASKPVVLISGEPAVSRPLSDGIPVARQEAARLVVGGSPRDWAASLTDMASGVTILHEGEGAEAAARLFSAGRLSTSAVTFVSRPGPIHGAADPSRLFPSAIAVGSEVVGPVRKALDEAESMWDLICILLSPRNANHLAIRVVPAALGGKTKVLTGPPADVALFGRGPLVVRGHITTPVRKTSQTTTDLRGWVRGRKWSDRARLALPWRFGLLARAMKGRW